MIVASRFSTASVVPRLDEGLYADFRAFTAEQIASWDIDPHYPFLKYVAARRGLGEEEAIWLTALHIALCNPISALIYASHYPGPAATTERALTTLPTGTERRGHRDPRAFVLHMEDYVARIARKGSQTAFWTEGLTEDGIGNFWTIYGRSQTIYGNGRWAAYKWAELLMFLHGFRVAFPSDLCLTYDRGPRYGLRVLYRLRDDPDAVAFAADDLLRRMRRDGFPDLMPEQLETVLCDFGSMTKGRYYPGNDIDQQLGYVTKAPLDRAAADLRGEIFAARSASFPDAYLGERHGWAGIDTARQKVYAATGAMPFRGPGGPA